MFTRFVVTLYTVRGYPWLLSYKLLSPETTYQPPLMRMCMHNACSRQRPRDGELCRQEKTRERVSLVLFKKVAIALSYTVVLLVQLMLVALTGKAAQGQVPVGYWKFDEGSGTTAFDSTGNGHNALLSSGLRWVRGVDGWAISADAIDPGS